MGRRDRRDTLAITVGDPAGIGPEIVARAIGEIESPVPIRVFGSWELTRRALDEAGVEAPFEVIIRGTEDGDDGAGLVFVDVGTPDAGSELAIGTVSAIAGRAALDAIDAAVDAVQRGEAGAIVTAPINKAAIRLAGATVPGHTELLAAKACLEVYGRDYAMYFDSPSLRVALLTVHVALREVAGTISAERVHDLARLVHREYERLEGTTPRIAVAGLNPHGGEGGLFGDEEELIAKGVRRSAHSGMKISGPHPPDTVFHSAREGRYDVVLAMYHDQGLIAVKTLHFNQSVNVTIGLPWLRASVDHGTAFDIAGKGVADHAAMKHVIEWTLARIVRR